jgi:hypothetical protein
LHEAGRAGAQVSADMNAPKAQRRNPIEEEMSRRGSEQDNHQRIRSFQPKLLSISMMNKISRRLLTIDEGHQRMWLVDTSTDTFHWQVDLGDFPLARDMQRLDAQRALVGYDHGFFELDIESGRVLKSCARWTEVTSVHRRADGCTLVTGYNLDGTKGVNVLTLDTDLQIIDIARRDGDYVRLMRPTPENTYLLCTNDHIVETSLQLVEIRRFAVPGFAHAWKADRLAEGRTLVSAGYGTFMALFDSAGNCIKRFGTPDQVPVGVEPYFYATFHQLENGNLLVANWQGHGPDNGSKGEQLLEFNAAHQLIGTWSSPDRISSLQGILPL